MIENFPWGTTAPSLINIIDRISDFVALYEQSAARRDEGIAACRSARSTWSFHLVERAKALPSLLDETTPSRATSAYSKSTEARRAERCRKAMYLLALTCL